MLNKSIKMTGLSIVAACVLAVAPFSVSYAGDAPKKEAKQMTCKQEGKKNGLKGKDLKQYIKDCKKARKKAKKEGGEAK